MDPREIEALMERYRQPAIMLFRPYPPGRLPKTNSHLGGLPALPPGTEWPRRADGTPLHFLAQIDCTELPPTDGVLPSQGMLFFFASIVEYMDWAEGNSSDGVRVLFTADPGPPPEGPPDGIPAIESGWSYRQKYFTLPGEPPPFVYPYWPVISRPIQSWPDSTAIQDHPEGDLRDYQDAVWHARAAEGVRASGLPAATGARPHWNPKVSVHDYHSRATLPEDAETPFPQVWVMVDRIARRLATWSRETIEREAKRKREDGCPFDLDLLARISETAVAWARTAADHGLATAPDDQARRRFKDWLWAVLTEHRMHLTYVREAMQRGMKSAIQYAAASPEAAALFPARYFEEAIDDHLPTALVTWNPPNTRVFARYHQMLGRTGSSQDSRPVGGSEIMLLQLFSDYGVDFMFCDVGEIEFWIDKDDLAARRFDRVAGYTCGG